MTHKSSPHVATQATAAPTGHIVGTLSRRMSRIEKFLDAHVVLVLRLAACTSITTGLIGGYIWLVALADRSDGDDLRWGFFHNPFMQFPPFNEPFLDLTIWILLACSAAAGLGGLMLLPLRRWGVPLITWEARVSIVINTVIAFFVVATMVMSARERLPQTFTTLYLRLGSITVDLVLWAFLSSNVVRDFFLSQSHSPGRGFEVISNSSLGAS